MGATEIKVAPMRKNENEYLLGKTEKFPTNAALGKEGITDALARAIASLMEADVDGIAIASAGDIDTKTATITYATENLPGMIGFDFAKFCKENFHLSATAINDAHAALIGEMAYGAGKAYADLRVCMLTLGSGVGGGYFANGDIVSNKENDFGRFGHVCLEEGGRLCTCGRRGCTEMYLSGRAIHKDAQAMGIDGPHIFERYAEGKEENLQFVNTLRQNLRLTLDKIMQISPFDICIIGGGVADWMGEHFSTVMADLGYPIIKASLGNNAGMVGAFAHYQKMQKI